jgi:transposase
MKNAYNHRLRLVAHARQHGIKATARLFQTTVPTVRKWLRRYQQQGPSGLIERSRAHHHCSHKTPPEFECQVIQLRRQLPTFGAARLKREFQLAPSHKAIQRIWRAHGLIHKRRRKYQKKQELAAVKATWRLFQQISADTKDLGDIPRYWPQAQRLRLPWVQYTAREVRSGLLFRAFASGRSASASAVFAQRIQRHLDRCGVDLRHLVWQTDNELNASSKLQRDDSIPGARPVGRQVVHGAVSAQREQWSSTNRRDPAHHNEHKICLAAVFTALQTA